MTIVRLYPLIVVQAYLTVTVLMFAVGPWDWPVRDGYVFYGLLAAYQVALGVGYVCSLQARSASRHRAPAEEGMGTCDRLLQAAIILSLFSAVPLYMLRVGGAFHLGDILRNVAAGLTNPGQQYASKIQYYVSSESNVYAIAVVGLMAPLTWLLLPLSVFHWPRLRASTKTLVSLLFLFEIASWISIGTNKGLFDNLLILSVSYAARTAVWPSSKYERQRIVLVFLVCIIVTVAYLTRTVSSRMGSIPTYHEPSGVSVNNERLLMAITPASLKGAMIALDAYVTQGYYGMSLALHETFTSTLGLGNSYFLMKVAERVFEIGGVAEYTYAFKLARHGWDPLSNWHSFYTWIASDVSFWGVPVVMCMLGYLFAAVWVDVLTTRNPYALGLFCLLAILFAYIPANNQVFGFYNTFCAFWGLSALWLLSRTRFRLSRASGVESQLSSEVRGQLLQGP